MFFCTIYPTNAPAIRLHFIGMDTPNVDVSMHSLHRSSQTARLPKRDSDDVELPSVLPLNRAALKRSGTASYLSARRG